jgi:hypothetical protein
VDKKKKLSEKEMRRLAKALTFGSRYGSRMPMEDAMKLTTGNMKKTGVEKL